MTPVLPLVCTAALRLIVGGWAAVRVPRLIGATASVRAPPVPAELVMIAPGALVSVPLVTVSCAVVPLVPLIAVRSIVPLFVNPFAMVANAAQQAASPCTTSDDAPPVVTVPVSDEDARSVSAP